MPEQITLSYALDLIAQSKSDIKTSIGYKGGTVGDDLTEYNESINNIKFRSLVVENEKNLFIYDNYKYLTVEQYLDGTKSFPEDLSYVINGSYVNVEMVTEPSGASNQRFKLTPVDFGTSYLNIHDNIGNCDYPVTINVPTFDISAEVTSYVGFLSVGNDINTGNLTAEWDTSAQSHTISFVLDAIFKNNDTAILPASVVSVDALGTMIDENQVNISYATGVGVNELVVTVTPVNDCYNGSLQLTITDGTSNYIFALDFIGGTDIQPSGEFTWDGVDSNDPIEVNVDLSNPSTAEININLHAPETSYDYYNPDGWGIDAQDWSSDDSDFPICVADFGGPLQPKCEDEWDELGNMKSIWTNGPTQAGTYIKSYTCTFTYNSTLTNNYDPETGTPIDDPVAQALDGTVITFYVKYNVTDNNA